MMDYFKDVFDSYCDHCVVEKEEEKQILGWYVEYKGKPLRTKTGKVIFKTIYGARDSLYEHVMCDQFGRLKKEVEPFLRGGCYATWEEESVKFKPVEFKHFENHVCNDCDYFKLAALSASQCFKKQDRFMARCTFEGDTLIQIGLDPNVKTLYISTPNWCPKLKKEQQKEKTIPKPPSAGVVYSKGN